MSSFGTMTVDGVKLKNVSGLRERITHRYQDRNDPLLDIFWPINGLPITLLPLKSIGLFEGYKAEDWTGIDGWHYTEAYKAFRRLYPRISTGNPWDPWRVEKGDFYDKRHHKNCRNKWSPSCCEMESYHDKLEPLRLKEVAPQIRKLSTEDGNSSESSV